MKKLLSILAALALTISLVACTPPTNEDPGDGGDPIPPFVPGDGDNNIETPNYPVGGGSDWQ